MCTQSRSDCVSSEDGHCSQDMGHMLCTTAFSSRHMIGAQRRQAQAVRDLIMCVSEARVGMQGFAN